MRSLSGARGADEPVALEPNLSPPARSTSDVHGEHDTYLATAFCEPDLEELDRRFRRGLDLLLDALDRA